MAIKYFGEDRMKQLLALIKGQLDLKATPNDIAKAITDANLAQYALDADLDAAVLRIAENESDITAIQEALKSVATTEGLETLTNDVNTIKGDYLKGDDKTELSDAIAAEQERAEGVESGLDTRVKAIEDDYLKAADKTELQTAIADAVKAHDESDAAHAALFKALNDKDAAMQGEIDALEEKIGEVPADKTVVEMISDAQTAATYDDTQVKADIAANADAIQAEKERMDAFMTLEDGQTLNAALDSLKEIQDFITNEAADADVLLGKVSALEAIVAGIGGEGEPATVVAYVTAAIEALKIGDYAKAADLTALADRVAAMEAKVSNWDAAEQNAKDYADGLNTAMDTRMQAVEGAKHTHDNKAVLDGITAEMVAAWNEADTEYTEDEVTAMWNEVFGA